MNVGGSKVRLSPNKPLAVASKFSLIPKAQYKAAVNSLVKESRPMDDPERVGDIKAKLAGKTPDSTGQQEYVEHLFGDIQGKSTLTVSSCPLLI